MYIFDLVSRRLLLIRKSLLRTRRDELAFDDVLCVKASHRTPQDPLDFLNVQITTVDGRMIDISPMGFCW